MVPGVFSINFVLFYYTWGKVAWTCPEQKGAVDIPGDNNFHYAGTANCDAPNHDTVFQCVASAPSGYTAEAKMEGNQIWIRTSQACPPGSKAVLQVSVKNTKSGEAMEKANVTTSPLGLGGATNSSGYFEIPVPMTDITYAVTAVMAGCKPSTVEVFVKGECSKIPVNIEVEPVETTPCANENTGDPVNTFTGAFGHSVTDLSLPIPGGRFAVARIYDSLLSGRKGIFGYGWTANVGGSRIAVLSNGNVLYDTDSGCPTEFVKLPGGAYRSPPGLNLELSANLDGSLTVRFKDGRTETFDGGGRLVAQSDPDGNTSAITYTGQGFVVTVSGGRSVSFELDAQGRVARMTDPLGRRTEYRYNEAGDLYEVAGPGPGTFGYRATYTYTDHLLTEFSDPRAAPGHRQARNTYDRRLRVTEQVSGRFRPRRTSLFYSDASPSTTITGPRGNMYRHEYDEQGRIARVTGPLGETVAYEWGPNVTLSRQVDALGRESAWTYDARGNVLTRRDPMSRLTSYTHDSIFNQVLTVTDPAGRVTTNTLDSLGHVTAVANPQGCGCASRTYSYDLKGLLVAQADANGNVTRYSYDSSGNRTEVIDALGRTSRSGFDALGRMTSATDALGQVTRMEYDGGGNLIRQVLPDGATVRFTYDERGNRIASTDPNNNVTSFTFDEFDNMESMRDPRGGITRFSYDDANSLVGITDANGNFTRHEYDLLNRRTSTTDALGRAAQQEYDAAGNVVLRTDAKGTVTRLDYDALNRLAGTRATDGSFTRFEYDISGNRILAANEKTRETSSYDILDRLVEQKVERVDGKDIARSIFYEYDNAGNRTAVTYPDGRRVQYAYDALNRPVSALLPGNGGEIRQEYGAAGQKSRRIFPNGLTTEWRYDVRDQLTDIVTGGRKKGMSAVPSMRYSYDSAGNRTGLDRSDEGLTSFSYDSLNQLVEAKFPDRGFQRFTYDPVGNRLKLEEKGVTTSYTYDAANQLTASQEVKPVPPARMKKTAYSFDLNGNMTSEYSGPKSTSYYWDSSNRLVRLALPEGHEVTHAYDCFNRRLMRKSGNEAVYYTWDGNTAVYESSGDLQDNVLYITMGGEIVGVIGRERGDGKAVSSAKAEHIRYYHGDGVGSVVAITDERGNVVRRASYKPFGEVRAPDAPADDPHGYVGQYGPLTDNSTGLVYMVNRYVLPARGQFLSQDPFTMGYSPAKSPYSYANSRPVNDTDPEGLLVGSQSGICAYKIFKAVFTMQAGDKYKHCLASCRISLECGLAISFLSGFGKEFLADIWPGGWEFEFADLAANMAGYACAAKISSSVLECKPQNCPECCSSKYPE